MATTNLAFVEHNAGICVYPFWLSMSDYTHNYFRWKLDGVSWWLLGMFFTVCFESNINLDNYIVVGQYENFLLI